MEAQRLRTPCADFATIARRVADSTTTGPARAAAAAVLHCAARARRRRGGEGPRAARQLRPRQPRGRAAGARDRGGAAGRRGRAIATATPPFRGLPELKEAIAARYRDVYGVELDPAREVAVVPGTKTALVELCLVLAERGDTILLPDPGYPDYFSAVALADAHARDASRRPSPILGAGRRASTSTTPRTRARSPRRKASSRRRSSTARSSSTTSPTATSSSTAASRRASSPRPARKEVGVELFSMSKSYGMAGWRLGFVVGNAEIVERINLLQDHNRAGRLPRRPGGRDRGADRAAGLRRRAPRALRGAPRPRARRAAGSARSARARSTSGSSSRTG